MGCAITRIVKFLRRGEKGNSLITAVTELRRYTQAQWQGYGKVGTKINWTGINNASDMKIGDTIVINGVVTDKENISVSLYGTIVAINGTSVEERATALIMSGESGNPGAPGEKGDRGPALRGPQEFSSLPTDYQFYQGADDEPYVDIVYYDGNYYKCVWTHKKGSGDISSGNGLSGKYWVLRDKVEMIATKILLASYALIKNLGVEAIEMKDGSDNIVFRAKDGKVICKSGTFENVTVIGNITAQSIRLHVTSSNSNIDGAVACGAWNNPIVLPELSDGECMNLKIYAPYGTRSSPDASVKPENSKVQIWVHGSKEIAESKEIGLGKGLFDAVGIGGGSYTIWAIR